MPDIIPDNDYVLKDNGDITTVSPSVTYNASTTVHNHAKEDGHTIVTGLRTIIDDIIV